MSDFEVKVIADSISAKGNRLTTFEVKYPFIIHAEVMTHRLFSRNFSSNRAIPSNKIVKNGEFYIPKDVRKNEKGMQGYEQISENMLINFTAKLSYLAFVIKTELEEFEKKVHKQHLNRYIMPFNYMYGVISATEWENFFNLRMKPDVQPEMQILAKMIYDERNKSQPNVLKYGEWHIPYLLDEEKGNTAISLWDKLLISAARCARVSYMKHGTEKIDLAEDIELGNKLFDSNHLSPFEHAATVGHSFYYANYKGFIQFRKFLETGITDLDSPKIQNMYINGVE